MEMGGAMDQTKPITWFGDDRKPSDFFFRSPFRSWDFAFNTALLAAVLVAGARVFWKYWGSLGDFGVWILLLFWNVVYSYWWAMKRHAQINELHLSGQIAEQPVGSSVGQILEVADHSLNEGLRNTLFLSLFLIICIAMVLGKSVQLK
jgi:hypothetical protein